MALTEQITALFDVETIKAIEARAVNDLGISAETLMDRAGLAAFQCLAMFEDQKPSITVFCGAGNNAGDGYVMAKYADEADFDVSIYPLVAIDQLSGAAKSAAEACLAAGIPTVKLEEALLSEVYVDALLGTGLDREVSGQFADTIDAINDKAAFVLALDVPSGLDADSGCMRGAVIEADVTITFIAGKTGLCIGDGLDFCGELLLDDLGIAESDYDDLSETLLCIEPELADVCLDDPRDRSSHKGDFGHILVIGGNYGMAGAVCLAAETALSTGAGLVTVATRPEHVTAVIANRPELLCYGINTAEDLKPLLLQASVIILGPGLGQDEWAKSLWAATINEPTPKVIDADALNLLANNPCKRDDWILTPHPGEAARLLDCQSHHIQQNRLSSVQQITEKYGGVAVLKGAGTVINSALDDECPMLCLQGNPGMATAGMGDVLSGLIASLYAQGLYPTLAAEVGCYLHAVAGDKAAEELGERCMIASDVIDQLREGIL